jgi:hypothetical protein
VAGIGERVAASVPQHVGMDRKGEACAHANAFDQPVDGVGRERARSRLWAASPASHRSAPPRSIPDVEVEAGQPRSCGIERYLAERFPLGGGRARRPRGFNSPVQRAASAVLRCRSGSGWRPTPSGGIAAPRGGRAGLITQGLELTSPQECRNADGSSRRSRLLQPPPTL